MSRGLSNRNPGNIRLSSTLFKGEKESSTDPEFKQFRSMAWGYRAMFVILNTYSKRYNLSTVREMIYRWAPPTENHSDKYVEYVSRAAMLDADTPIVTTQRETMIAMVAAMSQIENGQKADWGAVERGWDLFVASI